MVEIITKISTRIMNKTAEVLERYVSVSYGSVLGIPPKVSMFLFTRFSRQNPLPKLAIPLTRHLSSTAATFSKLHDHYSFVAPPTLSPQSTQNPNSTSTETTTTNKKKKQKPPYRSPSSLERMVGKKPRHSDLPFDFRYSYTESSEALRPIGLREPKYSPFGPGRLDRKWTGVCAPAVDRKVRSVDQDPISEDLLLEEKRRKMRERIQGEELTDAERKILVDLCQRNKTNKQINLGSFWICVFGV